MFNYLCLFFLVHHCSVQDQTLLACTDSMALSSSSFSSSSLTPLGHFLLLPSPSPSSLLIKPVVVSELLLPVEVSEGDREKATAEAMESVGNSLRQVGATIPTLQKPVTAAIFVTEVL